MQWNETPATRNLPVHTRRDATRLRDASKSFKNHCQSEERVDEVSLQEYSEYSVNIVTASSTLLLT